jgi:TRAP-type C4-dicarboxylate transport system permease small subunit
MKSFLSMVSQLSKVVNVIAGMALTAMMLLTVFDVVLRYLGKPILGCYELVSLGAAVVIGFSLPYTSWVKGHIGVDFLLVELPEWRRGVVLVFTRIMSIALFAVVGVYLIKKGVYMHMTGQVSMTLQMPFYPVAWGVAVCCFIQCLVLICDIVKVAGGNYE